MALLIMCLGAGIFLAREKVSHAITLLNLKRSTPVADTCAPTLYGWIREHTAEDSLFLIDPQRFPPFRVCALRGLVYHYRDGAAIAPSSNNLVEWYNRKQLVEAAYAAHNPEMIRTVAEQFQADYILSETCIPMPALKKVYEEKGAQCIYAL
jgi:hypothetical protein